MIKRNGLPKIIISLFLSIFSIVYVLLNTKLYTVYTDVKTFRQGYFVTALVSSVFIFILGSFRLELNGKKQKILGALVYIASIFGAMHISVLFSDGFTSNIKIYFLNILFYLGFAMIGLIVSGSMRVSAIVSLACSYIFNAISFIIYSFRGSSLSPSDLYAFKTAMNVASEYDFTLKYQMVTATIFSAAMFMLAAQYPLNLKFFCKQLIMRAAGAVCLIAIVTGILNYDHSKHDVSEYDQYYANLVYGSAFSFYVNSTKMGLEKRDDYDPDKLNKLLTGYTEDEINAEEMPNIVVIMNESFSDLRVINNFETNEEFLPYYKSMKKNTIKGDLFVTPLGGYTCNTEYDFLTGMSTALLSARSTPYLQMIFDKLPYSLNTHMKQLGYTTTAMHPFYGDGWNRKLVYDYLDFDEFISLENFTEYSEYPEYTRNYISDKSNYDALLNMLYKKDSSEKKFIFNITIQNHGGYTDTSYENDIKLQGFNGEYPQAEQYLSLMKDSDEALEYFIESLKMYPEPVMVLMFGDHQPNVEREFYEELYGTSLSSLGYDMAQKRYVVPFMIWANYDIIDVENEIHTSPCYLSNILMEAAGLPKSRVQQYLDSMRWEMPQLNQMGYYDAGGYFHTYSGTGPEINYYNMQYALLHGENLEYDYDYKPLMDAFVETPVITVYDQIQAGTWSETDKKQSSSNDESAVSTVIQSGGDSSAGSGTNSEKSSGSAKKSSSSSSSGNYSGASTGSSSTGSSSTGSSSKSSSPSRKLSGSGLSGSGKSSSSYGGNSYSGGSSSYSSGQSSISSAAGGSGSYGGSSYSYGSSGGGNGGSIGTIGE